MDVYILSAVLIIGAASLLLWGRQKSSIAILPGPPCESWLLGHERILKTPEEAGVLETQWTKEHGNVLRIGGCFGTDHLLIADPKAIQHIFTGYRYEKTADLDHINFSLLGEGLISVGGETHKRQRQILNPAFSVGQLKNYLSIFQAEAAKLCDILKGEVGGGDSGVVNVAEWTSRIALDLIGLTSFRHDFKSVDRQEDKSTDKMKNVVGMALGDAHPITIAAMALWNICPVWILYPLDLALRKLTPFGVLRLFQNASKRLARDIVNKAIEDKDHFGEKDIIGLLATSTLASDRKKKMTNNEIMSQMSSFIFAGQDTTSMTLAFLLYEIAKNPKDQSRIRAEILDQLSKNGGEPLTLADYESLPFFNACIKESMRLHSIGTIFPRRPVEDDVIPLSQPVKLADGTFLSQLPIQKNQPIYCSVFVYNRLKSVWGNDAEEWNPERFLSDRKDLEQTNVGVIANLLNFGSGTRGCIGWRFAMMEMRVITSLLLQNFELEVVANIVHASSGHVLFPAVEGKQAQGVQVPLRLKTIG